MTTWLHHQRLEAVCRVVHEVQARRILDLGCGTGDLLMQLIEKPMVERIVAIDLCSASLARLSERLQQRTEPIAAAVELVGGSMLAVPHVYKGFDCALLVETIEHIDPGQLSALERSLFVEAAPACAVVTTPNAEFNALLGVPQTRFRHPDHRFEWTRNQFRKWAAGLANRTGYTVACSDIAGRHPRLGGASQMAVFRHLDTPAR